MRTARRWLYANRWDLVAVAIILAAFAVPLRGLMRFQGPPMEEGFMLTFPQEVLHGSVPNRDFLHLYGPGSLWALAGAYGVFGTSLATERIFGLVQHLAFVLAMFAVARRWGRVVGLVCALTAFLIVVPPAGLTALAWNGGLALCVWAAWFATRTTPGPLPGVCDSASSVDGNRRELFVAGLLGGFALLFRPDMVIGLSLGLTAAVWPVWPLRRRRLGALAAGLAAGVSPIIIHVATAGWSAAFGGMVTDPVLRLRPGRRLPVPPSWNELDGWFQKASGLRTVGWSLPSPDLSHQVALWFWILLVSVAFVAVVGTWTAWRHPFDLRARTLRTMGLLGLGLVGQALQRPDTTHLAWVSCIPIALVPVAVSELFRHGRPVPRSLRLPVAVLPVVVFVVTVIPHFTVRAWVDLSRQSFGRDVFGYAVHNRGRNFYLGSPEIARAAEELLVDLDRRAEPGQRLFVGPVDLRRTPYGDSYFYFLLPQLVPATYFIELDPGIADAAGSRLATDVGSADWLILSNVWTTWREPNASDRTGPDAANRVVDEHFCRVGRYGADTTGQPWFELFERCR